MGILPAFQGTAVHDFWALYFGYACSHAICNAHLFRELRGITENFGHQWSGALGNHLSEIKASVDAAKKEERVPTPEKIAAFEEQYLRILEVGKEELEASWFHEMQGKHGRKKQSKAKNLQDRCYKYQKEILAFMRIPASPSRTTRLSGISA